MKYAIRYDGKARLGWWDGKAWTADLTQALIFSNYAVALKVAKLLADPFQIREVNLDD